MLFPPESVMGEIITVLCYKQGMLSVEFASDSALLVNWPSTVSLETSRLVLGLFERLRQELAGQTVEFHPAFCSLLIEFNPHRIQPGNLKSSVEAALKNIRPLEKAGAKVVVPVQYDGEDLEEVARQTGRSVLEVIRRHSEVEYWVAFLGFAPGFPYLLGLPGDLKCPRKENPRTRVPAGSVAITGELCGIYPLETPGGWQLLGRTNMALDLKPGDRVRFEPKEKLEFSSPPVEPNPLAEFLSVEVGANLVNFTGAQEPGRAHLGISPGGPADDEAFTMANYLVSNSANARAVEIAALGPVEISFLRDTWIAVTGAECSPALDQMPLMMGASIPVSAGQRLSTKATRFGFRSYVAVHNGAGSPRHLRAPKELQEKYKKDHGVLRVTRGPQAYWFTKDMEQEFARQEYTVSPDVSRRGVRLEGLSLKYREEFAGREMISEGIANGAIQVPPSGQPVILFCEQRTTGGYPKAANVIRADLNKIGQLRPGQKVRLEFVSLEDAWSIST